MVRDLTWEMQALNRRVASAEEQHSHTGSSVLRYGLARCRFSPVGFNQRSTTVIKLTFFNGLQYAAAHQALDSSSLTAC